MDELPGELPEGVAAAGRHFARSLMIAAIPGTQDEDLDFYIAVFHEEDENRHPDDGVWVKVLQP
jgi:hypothetical protein